MYRRCFRIRNLYKVLVVCAAIACLLYLARQHYHDTDLLFSLKVDRYEQEIRDMEARVIYGLGEDGRAAYLDGEEKKLGQQSLKAVALNTVLSDRIPLDRRLKDPRHPDCAKLTHDVRINASVVIIFYNEPFSVLLRTVWSIIGRTPHNLLHEVILVDDASDSEPLGRRLDHYVATRFARHPVRLVRSERRLGLIRARLKGARAATGHALVFLDAHCEVTEQWLQPLLARVQQERTAVVVPIIDVIEADTLLYSTNGHSFQVGGFSWSGHFTWINVQRPAASAVQPVPSPTMAGGLFGVERAYFWEVGSYDEQMDGWGGENLEMSFRVWQCGGRLETVPCSRVGHIFREFHPYKFPHGKDTHGINSARMAHVWMDGYARLYFLHQPGYRDDPAVGDLTHRRQLRAKLRCRPFSWYLRTVYPEKFVPTEAARHGQVRVAVNGDTAGRCLDNLQLPDDTAGPLGLYQCHARATPSQLFALSHAGELRQEETCAEVTAKGSVQLAKCHGHAGTQLWRYDAGLLLNPQTGQCLSAAGVQTEPLLLADCSRTEPQQNWTFVNPLL